MSFSVPVQDILGERVLRAIYTITDPDLTVEEKLLFVCTLTLVVDEERLNVLRFLQDYQELLCSIIFDSISC